MNMYDIERRSFASCGEGGALIRNPFSVLSFLSQAVGISYPPSQSPRHFNQPLSDAIMEGIRCWLSYSSAERGCLIPAIQGRSSEAMGWRG
jgi:hypothetical protein